MKKLRRLISLVMLLCCILTLSAPAAYAADDSKMLAEAKKGVVKLISVIYSDNARTVPQISFSGTGFAVGEVGKDTDVFVTNCHVVAYNGEDGYIDSKNIRVFLMLDNGFIDSSGQIHNGIECDVLYSTVYDGGTPDYAIIRAKEPVKGFKALPIKESKKVASGARIYALGYPGVTGDNNIGAASGIDDITITSGIVSQHMTDKEGVNVIGHDAKLDHGNSGGPLITADGCVIGINTYYVSKTENYFYAVASEYIIDCLDRLGLPHGSSKIDTKLIVLIGAAVAAVAVIVLVVVLLTGRKNSAGKNSRWLRAPDGSLIPIKKKPISVGRSSSCDVCVPELNGVSRQHCTLRLNGDYVVLTDIGSTYGTFVGGRKLMPNTPVSLTRGSQFYLGEAKNTFTIM